MKTREPLLTESGVFPALPSLRRDIAVVGIVTLAVAFLSARFELNETFHALTRRWEFLELDEWPTIALTLTLCLIWLSWRRYGLALSQLEARRSAENRLAGALAENRRLAAEHMRALEAERKHLAREVHDELGQYTNAIKLDAIAMRAAARGPDATETAERILKAVDHMHAVTGSIIRRLRPAGLDDLGLVAALEHCVDHWRRRLPETRIQFSATGEFDDLGEFVKLALYRLVQEGLTNSFRHSGARHIDIELRRETRGGDQVSLRIDDDGKGADLNQESRGFGLSGMRERVELLGGSFEARSQPAHGFALGATLPATQPGLSGIER